MIHTLYRKNILQCLILILVCMYTISTRADSTFNPHNLEKLSLDNNIQCLSCHKTQPAQNTKFTGKYVIPVISRFIKNETAMCNECHGDDNTSHIVGVSPNFTVPADLPLNKENQVTCLTCHYVHGSLKTDRVMASTSLMDHIFNRARLGKSYILRRNNAEGDLCLSCHSK